MPGVVAAALLLFGTMAARRTAWAWVAVALLASAELPEARRAQLRGLASNASGLRRLQSSSGCPVPWCSIAAMSGGYYAGNKCSFTIDSTETECPSNAYGFNLRVLDADGCSIVDAQHFNTYNGGSAASNAMKTYVEGLHPGTLVLVAVKYSATGSLYSTLKTAMADAFGVQELAYLSWRNSYAAILANPNLALAARGALA